MHGAGYGYSVQGLGFKAAGGRLKLMHNGISGLSQQVVTNTEVE